MREGADGHEGHSEGHNETTLTLNTYEIQKLELAADALEALATTGWGTRQRVFQRMLGFGRFKYPHPEHQVQMQMKLLSASDLIKEKVLGAQGGGNGEGSTVGEPTPPPTLPRAASTLLPFIHHEDPGDLGLHTQ